MQDENERLKKEISELKEHNEDLQNKIKKNAEEMKELHHKRTLSDSENAKLGNQITQV